MRELRGPIPAPPDRAASIDLLEDVFSSLDMEAALQPLGQAKSLEDLRAPKDLREQPGSFDYQVCLWVPRAHEVGPPGHSGVEEIRETPLQHPYSPPTLPHHKQQAHHATSCHGGGVLAQQGVSACLCSYLRVWAAAGLLGSKRIVDWLSQCDYQSPLGFGLSHLLGMKQLKSREVPRSSSRGRVRTQTQASFLWSIYL